MNNQPDRTPKNLFNPLKTDFTLTLRDEFNDTISITIYAHDSAEFPAYLARVIEKKLIDQMFNESGDWNKDHDIQREEMRKQVEMFDI